MTVQLTNQRLAEIAHNIAEGIVEGHLYAAEQMAFGDWAEPDGPSYEEAYEQHYADYIALEPFLGSYDPDGPEPF